MSSTPDLITVVVTDDTLSLFVNDVLRFYQFSRGAGEVRQVTVSANHLSRPLPLPPPPSRPSPSGE